MRTMAEIVVAVDAHPKFQGTARLYNSKLWELFSLKSISEAEIFQRIDDVFVEFGVERYAMPPKEESWRTGRNPAFDVENPINSIEEMRLQKANLDQATWHYLRLLQYLSSKTTILRDSNVLLEIFSHSLVNLFERKNEDFGREYKPYLLKWIQEAEVIRIFGLNLH